ncbi:MAG TPA: FlgD immunoglobulin-like domain containing protein [Gaiellaceae bacterium]
MARFLPVLLVIGLLGGSAAAFAVTERLKLERSPVFQTLVDKAVSARSGKRAQISFRLREADDVSVAIVDASGRVVRSLPAPPRPHAGLQRFAWDGRDDAGRAVADGTYKPRLRLPGEHRTILLPNPIVVDNVAPRISAGRPNLTVFSPDGDYRHDYLLLRYRASEPAHALLYANGRLVVENKAFATSGTVEWRPDGLRLPPGRYRLRLRALDEVNNLGRPSRPIVVRIRYIELARHRISVRSGGRVVVRVYTDASAFRWRIGSRAGRVRGRTLVLPAGAPGTYQLIVSERGFSDRALLVVAR